tara:strand:+ start:4082 stop:5545 length:1464 start_codon:yes stop_codon:yes gene_type:complete
MNETQTRPNTNYIDGNRAEQLLEKWSPVLDYTSNKVSAIKDSHTRLNTAMLLENQEKWCIEEANQSGAGGSLGTPVGNTAQGGGAYNTTDTYSAGDSRLPKILIPMIRRTFPELITNEIVGVQPMSGPVGLAFALRYKYSGTGIAGGAASAPGTPETTSVSGGVAGEVGYNLLDSRYTGKAGTHVDSLSWTGQSGAANGVAFADEDKGLANALASFELDSASAMPTLELSFEKTAVEAGTRRLGARWSVELEQDLKNMNGIDVDSELTNAMSYEIQAEIDREMIIRMIQAAIGGTSGQHYSTFNVASADGRWVAERNRAVYQKLIIEANRMAVRNRRGAANFIVATPRVCSILEMLPEFSWMQVEGNVNTAPIGVAKVGNVGGRFNVYRDTRTEAQYNLTATDANKVEYALLGYKGPEYYDSGIIYCPYIPVMIQRSIDPNGFYPKVGLLTRYGVVDHLFGAENYYHVCFITGMNIATTSAQFTPYA